LNRNFQAANVSIYQQESDSLLCKKSDKLKKFLIDAGTENFVLKFLTLFNSCENKCDSRLMQNSGSFLLMILITQ